MQVAATPEQYAEELRQIKEQIEKNTGKTTDQLYEEREKRVRDAIELEIPDRVPFAVHGSVAAHTGVSNSAAYYDPLGFKTAMRQFTLDFEPDMCNAGLPTSGAAMEVLDVQNRLWPGGPLPPDYDYQFIEGEYMKAEEYDLFINDPTDFFIRHYLPRVYGAMAPLSKLPPLSGLYMGFEGVAMMMTSPEFLEMAQAVQKAGKEMDKFRTTIGDAYEELGDLGFPPFAHVGTGGVGGAPFDTLSSFLRGMTGSMVDMYRCPEKLLKACDLILERRIANAVLADPKKRGNPKRTGMPLWRGDKAFMSEKQFEKFYWPGLKKALQATIDLGYVPIPFFEAEFGDRLERLLELPKGKIIASIEYMDSKLARDVLADHCCIFTRAPLSSKIWSLNQLESYLKDLIDMWGGKSGLILDIRIPDKAPKEGIQTMLNSIREYGRY